MSKQSKELRGYGKEELSSRLTELRKELIKLSSQIAVGTAVKNPGQVSNVKKNISRIVTIQRQKITTGGQKKE